MNDKKDYETVAEQSNQEVFPASLEEEIESLKKDLKALELKNHRLAMEVKGWEEKYNLLANAKLGRLTLRFWRFKDKFRYRVKAVLKKVKNKLTALRRGMADKKKLQAYAEIKKRKDLPSISVIIPTWRDNAYIGPCVDSVLAQDYPKEKIKVLVVVNGPDRAYWEKLKRLYQASEQVEVLHTEKKGAGAGRNYGVEHVKTDCIAFLDDDDLFSVGYLKSMAVHMVNDVSFVCGGLCDYDENINSMNPDTYVNRSLTRVGKGAHHEYLSLGSFLTSLPAKLYKTALFQRFEKIDEDVANTEDVVFWCQNFQHISGAVYTCAPSPKDHYMRRKHTGSLSRPSDENALSFYGKERIQIIEKLSGIIFTLKDAASRRFVLNTIKAQTTLMRDYYNQLDERGKAAIAELVQKSDAIFLNKSLFGQKRGIAFCHNFSPYIDASSYVATRRLSQVSSLEQALIAWTVVSADMSSWGKTDPVYKEFFAEFQYEKNIVIGSVNTTGDPGLNHSPKAQNDWGYSAYDAVKDEDAEVIYSRSMCVGSHIAAYLYKQAHPGVRWYAEFSDPVYMNIDNRPRVAPVFTGADADLNDFWAKVEKMVFELADQIIFTNKNQREFMLKHTPYPEYHDRVMAHSRVIHHPVMDSRYCELVKSGLKVPEEMINVAFFGTLYGERRADDLFQVLDHPNVMLHLFTDNVVNLDRLPPDARSRVSCHLKVPFFEFLNICTHMDYLIVNDANFEDLECNPYLPSKVADYLASKTPILALTYGNSPLASMDIPGMIRMNVGSDFAVANLEKKRK